MCDNKRPCKLTNICVTTGGHVIDYLTKEYIGAGEDGSPIMGAITYKDGIGSLYSFDVEGSIPLFEGKDGVIDGGRA